MAPFRVARWIGGLAHGARVQTRPTTAATSHENHVPLVHHHGAVRHARGRTHRLFKVAGHVGRTDQVVQRPDRAAVAVSGQQPEQHAARVRVHVPLATIGLQVPLPRGI